eukprot:3571395-Prymnesium_polylepis.2
MTDFPRHRSPPRGTRPLTRARLRAAAGPAARGGGGCGAPAASTWGCALEWGRAARHGGPARRRRRAACLKHLIRQFHLRLSKPIVKLGAQAIASVLVLHGKANDTQPTWSLPPRMLIIGQPICDCGRGDHRGLGKGQSARTIN